MANVKVFARALEEQITKKLEPEVVRMKVEVAKAVFVSAVAASPVFSGYFASNWRITLGGTKSVKLHPTWSQVQRPPLKLRPGEFIGNISGNASAELAKLKRINPRRHARQRITISTAVPYANILETK